MTTAIYARQSINKKDSVSIETQIEICKKEIKDGDVRIYTDKGFSGKNTLRPSFQQLMSDVKAGLINNIVVYRLDRISRSVVDFANIVDVLNKHNVGFVSANEKFDTTAPVGKAMLYIVMVFAQLERETIAERIKDNYYMRGTEGVWLGGQAPFGFQNTKTAINGRKVATIEPTDDLPLVAWIFNEYIKEGMSLGQIAHKLTEERKEMWNNIKVGRILHNPAYVKADADVYNFYRSKGCIIKNAVEDFNGENGLNIYGKRDRAAGKYNNLTDHNVVVGLHKGIISSDIFLAVQDKLDGNKQICNNGKGKHTWLTGLIKCGYCGKAMVVRQYKDTKYFNCSGRAIGICSGDPATHYVADIEAAVYGELKEHIKEFENYTPTISSVNETEINNLKIKIVKIDNEINNLINSLAAGNTALIGYANEKILELDKQKKDLSADLNALNVKKSRKPDMPDISKWDSRDLEYKRNLAHILVEKISLYNDHIEIKWKY